MKTMRYVYGIISEIKFSTVMEWNGRKGREAIHCSKVSHGDIFTSDS